MDYANPDLYVTTQRYAMWERLAEDDQVIWTESGSTPSGFWSVFSHRSCRRVLSPSSPFTSEYGMMLGFDKDHPDKSAGSMLVVTDGHRHGQLRKLMGPLMSRIAADSLTRFIEEEIGGLLDQLREETVADIAQRVGPFIPAAVVCEILGVSASDRPHLIRLTNHAFGGKDESFSGMTPRQAHTEILSYFYELIGDRQRSPGGDLVSILLSEGGLTAEEVLLNCDNVLIGGNETTRHAITGFFHIGGTTPGMLERLRDDPGLVDTAVEETLRWTSPALHVLRVATDDVTIGDRDIPRGAPVVAWLPAANRDPKAFTRAQQFVVDRHPNRHLTFGTGTHHCLGAALARAELGVLLRLMSERVRHVELAQPPGWLRALVVQGYRSLEVKLEWW